MNASRKINPLPESFMHKLNLYAAGATAAGVSVLVPARPVEAKIVYSAVHIVVQEYQSVPLDLNQDGTTDLSIKVNVFSNSQFAQDVVGAFPAARNGIEGTAHINFYAAALSKGAVVGRKQNFGGETRGAMMASVEESVYGSFQYGGNWANVKRRYLGVKFKIKGKTHYGWVRANVWVTGQGPGAGAIVTGYAYETVPNQPIVAGETKGPDVILRPADTKRSTLGYLALGRK
jgi:hypothetical protein